MNIARPVRRALALLILTASASPAQIVGANADSIPNDSWVGIYFRRFDAAVHAAGLAPLRDTPLAAGEREVRIWTKAELGEPNELYRLTDRRGRVRGAMLYYWGASRLNSPIVEGPGETFHDLVVYGLRGRCDGFEVVSEMGVCRARYRREPDWNRALRAAESHGLWTLPDPSTLPSDGMIGIDGWTIVVEVRDGPRYRTYRYHDPWAHTKWPSAAQANEIARSLRPIDSLLVPSDVQRVYRGITTGKYRSAFHSCDGNAEWDFYSDLRSLVEHAPANIRASVPTLADSTVRDSSLYEVEVFGELTPEWLARRWESKFPRVLQVLELRAVRPSPTRECTPRRAR